MRPWFLPSGKPIGEDFCDACCALRACELGWCEEDTLLGIKTFGEVSKEFGEDLAFAALGAEKLSKDYPLRHLIRCWRIAIRDGVLRRVG